MIAKNVVPFGLAAVVGCSPYNHEQGDEQKNASVEESVEVVHQPEETTPSEPVQREFRPLDCEGIYAYPSTPRQFITDLFNNLENGTIVSIGEQDKLVNRFTTHPTIGYMILLDILEERLDDVPEDRQTAILCGAKETAKTLNGSSRDPVFDLVFEVDLVARLYKSAEYSAAGSYPELTNEYLTLADSIAEKTGVDTKPYAEKVVEAAYSQSAEYAGGSYPDLANKHLTLGNTVAEKTGVDTKPYAEKVVEAACKKAAEYADSSYPSLADKYVNLAATVAKKDSSVVCQTEK